jgi:hypothetical protein
LSPRRGEFGGSGKGKLSYGTHSFHHLHIVLASGTPGFEVLTRAVDIHLFEGKDEEEEKRKATKVFRGRCFVWSQTHYNFASRWMLRS